MRDLRRLVEQKRYIEALYFGAMAAHEALPAESFFLLGLSCCAVIKPLADFERMIHRDKDDITPISANSLRIGRDTILVMEAFRYFQRTLDLDPKFGAPASLHANMAEIRADVVQYAGQDFRGLPSVGDGKDRRVAAWQTVVLLERFQGLDPASKESYQDCYPYVQAKEWLIQGRTFA